MVLENEELETQVKDTLNFLRDIGATNIELVYNANNVTEQINENEVRAGTEESPLQLILGVPLDTIDSMKSPITLDYTVTEVYASYTREGCDALIIIDVDKRKVRSHSPKYLKNKLIPCIEESLEKYNLTIE